MNTRPFFVPVFAALLVLAGLVPATVVQGYGPAPAGVTEYFDKASFQSALTTPTTIDFDSLPASSQIVGNEYAAEGVMITHLNGSPINVVSAPPVDDSFRAANYGSGTNMISSSYASAAFPGYSPICCGMFRNGTYVDHIRFTFTEEVFSAGIYLSQKNFPNVRVEFLDEDGGIIQSKSYPDTTTVNVYYGIVSTTPIAALQVIATGNQFHGVMLDDLIFEIQDEGTDEDMTPPEVTTIEGPICLWPPNHKYHTIDLSDFITSVSDDLDETVDIDDVVITQVSSDEAQDEPGSGDGNTLDDMIIAPDCKSVQVRVERQGGGDGRVYTIHYSVSDASGNTTTGTFAVNVPHNQRGCDAVLTPDAGYTVTSNCAPVQES